MRTLCFHSVTCATHGAHHFTLCTHVLHVVLHNVYTLSHVRNVFCMPCDKVNDKLVGHIQGLTRLHSHCHE
jgi:hypothetical protein